MSESVIFAGTPEVAALVLRDLAESGIPISVVITKPDSPVGRKKVLTESAVARTARELGLRIIKSNQVDSAVLGELNLLNSKLAVVVAYGSILRKEALNSLELGWLNLHFSLLPRYRGPAPVQRALLEGETVTGVTLFRLDESIDTGSIVSKLETEITPDENSKDLLMRLASLGGSLLKQELPRIFSGFAKYSAQTGMPTQAPKLSRDESKVDFQKSSLEVHNQVRACNPEPGAWANSVNGELKIHSSRVASSPQLAPGELRLEGSHLFVGCGNNTILELLEVQPAGKSRMSGPAWFRGLSGEKSLH